MAMRRRHLRFRVGLLGYVTCALLCWISSCTMPPQKIELQGISGSFTTYRLPAPENCIEKYTTQEDLDFCKYRNAKRISEPLRGNLSIQSLDSFEKQTVTLDSNGHYRKELKPGFYTVCLGKSCSDAIEVRMQHFATYGTEYPLAAIDSILAAVPEKSEAAETTPQDSLAKP
jgi:hypothetical protein